MVAQALGELRLEMGRRMNLIDPNEFCFRWVTDFPMFEYSEEEKRYVAEHHPFTAPRDEDVQYLLTNPEKVYAKAYDMVLNGVEAGGGSLRIYQEELQERYSRPSESRKRMHRKNSDSCWMPSNMGHRRMQALPSASIVW